MNMYTHTDTRFVYRVFVCDLFLFLQDVDSVYDPVWLSICIYVYMCMNMNYMTTPSSFYRRIWTSFTTLPGSIYVYIYVYAYKHI